MNGDFQNLLALLAVALAGGYVGMAVWRSLASRRAAGCPSCAGCPSNQVPSNRAPMEIPLVTIGAKGLNAKTRADVDSDESTSDSGSNQF